MKKSIVYFVALVAMLLSLSVINGCRDQKSAGERMEDDIEEVGEDIEDGAEELGDDIEEGAEEVEEGVEDAVDDN